MGKLLISAGVTLRILCAVALLSLAFAHRPPQVVVAALESASLMLPDGSFADLCISEEGMKHPVVVVLCEACTLAGATLLPLPDDGAWLAIRLASLENRSLDQTGILAFFVSDHPRSRGPPAIS